MSVEVEAEAPRPRPLSAGIWTLFSWLRRDSSSSSSESLSSVGSDRTAVSFAFLSPAHYRAGGPPIHIPAPSAPTDSYKKRLHERNSRRQHDLDLTLHRKYGLYDAYTLPGGRRGGAVALQERERRAASEGLRRVAHVPGKRRAPPPPASSLPSRHTRKRPAPQPPNFAGKNKENLLAESKGDTDNSVQMNTTKATRNDDLLTRKDTSAGCKSEKYTKREPKNEQKTRSERSFLKQIFDKKRNSYAETPPVKILPSISELDKQAVEIIETCKLLEQNNNINSNRQAVNTRDSSGCSSENSWFCTQCLKKYDASVTNCPNCPSDRQKLVNKLITEKSKEGLSMYTQTDNKTMNVTSASKSKNADEREKLKEMLKEMKDSLPKRHKGLKNDESKSKVNIVSNLESNLETPTLKIGSSTSNELQTSKYVIDKETTETEERISNDETVTTPRNIRPATETVVVTQTVVLIDSPPNINSKKSNIQKNKEIFLSSNVTKDVIPKISLASTSSANNVQSKMLTDSNYVALNVSSTDHSVSINNASTKNSLATEVSSNATSKVQLESNLTTKDIAQKIPLVSNIPTSNDSTKVTSQTGTSTSSQNSQFSGELSNLHTPLKISSLFNPVYVPKKLEMHNQREPSAQSETKLLAANAAVKEPLPVSTSKAPVHQVLKVNPENEIGQGNKNGNPPEKSSASISLLQDQPKPNNLFSGPSTSSGVKTIADTNIVNQHSRRRDLINQLEQSIAKGDENAAAEAAAKLAQLRLSCSVLSFSSQIVADTSSTDKGAIAKSKAGNVIKPQDKIIKVDTATQSTRDKHDQIINKEGNKVQKNKSLITTSTPTAVANDNKVSRTSVPATSSLSTSQTATRDNDLVWIEVWIEDKKEAQGPIRIHIPRNSTVQDLRRVGEESLGIAQHLQRWIVDRHLCTDDSTLLATLAGPDLDELFYLYLVEADAVPAANTTKISTPQKQVSDKSGGVYSELMKLERQALVPNTESFECGVCMEQCTVRAGVVLRECVHTFCRDCLGDTVRHCEEPEVPCPALGCPGFLQEREIRALVSAEDYERWLAHGLVAAESGTRNAFHCRTPDCSGWALCEPGVRRFPCPVCKHNNCVQCRAIHEGETCEQYRIKIQKAVSSAGLEEIDEGTQVLIDSLISRGEALECPECKAIITKKWGCDWVKCSACKTEICWVTRGRRWGPAGRGDTSGGCRCGVDGNRCHPSCGYCH